MIILKEILNSPDDNDVGYFVKIGSKYSDEIKEKTENFPCAPEKK